MRCRLAYQFFARARCGLPQNSADRSSFSPSVDYALPTISVLSAFVLPPSDIKFLSPFYLPQNARANSMPVYVGRICRWYALPHVRSPVHSNIPQSVSEAFVNDPPPPARTQIHNENSCRSAASDSVLDRRNAHKSLTPSGRAVPRDPAYGWCIYSGACRWR